MITIIVLLSIIVILLFFNLLYKVSLSKTIKQDYIEPKGFNIKFTIGFIIFIIGFISLCEYIQN